MINQAELDLRVATHYTTVSQRNLPTGQHQTQRAVVPATLATKFLTLKARFAPHARHAITRSVPTTGTAQS